MCLLDCTGVSLATVFERSKQESSLKNVGEDAQQDEFTSKLFRGIEAHANKHACVQGNLQFIDDRTIGTMKMAETLEKESKRYTFLPQEAIREFTRMASSRFPGLPESIDELDAQFSKNSSFCTRFFSQGGQLDDLRKVFATFKGKVTSTFQLPLTTTLSDVLTHYATYIRAIERWLQVKPEGSPFENGIYHLYKEAMRILEELMRKNRDFGIGEKHTIFDLQVALLREKRRLGDQPKEPYQEVGAILQRALRLISFSKLTHQFDRVIVITALHDDCIAEIENDSYQKHTYGAGTTLFSKSILSDSEAQAALRSLCRKILIKKAEENSMKSDRQHV